MLHLQLVPPLCDYMVWIHTQRDADAIKYLRTEARSNIMYNEFRDRRMVEVRVDAYRQMHREVDCELEKEKREKERERKHEKARRTKATYAKGGEEALNKGKWQRLTQG